MVNLIDKKIKITRYRGWVTNSTQESGDIHERVTDASVLFLYI